MRVQALFIVSCTDCFFFGRSPEMDITIMSPSVRSVEGENGARQSLPVFGDHDRVTGSVALDPQNTAAESGRLTITVS